MESPPLSASRMGTSTSLYGNTVVFGAPGPGANGDRAYIFNKDVVTGIWSQQQIITGSSISSLFGWSVSLNNDTLAIGANYGGNGGRCYVDIYKFNGMSWILEQTIQSPVLDGSDWFGTSVSLVGNTLAVGAPAGLITGINNVYIYTRSATVWSLQATLTPALPNDKFGFSVSLYGNTLAVGSYFYDSITPALTNSGTVYIYTGSGASWTLQQQIQSTTPIANESFGYSVSLYNDRLAIGSLGTLGTMGVYIFTRIGGSWSQSQKILPPSGAQGSFGRIVSLYDTTLIFGSYFDGSSASGVNSSYLNTLPTILNAGAAFAYILSGGVWTLNAYIKAISPAANQNFGISLSVYGTTLAVGSSGYSVGTANMGAGYIYEPTAAPAPPTPSTIATIVEDPCCTFTNCIRVSLPTITQDSIITETQEAKTILSATNALYAGINNGTITSNPNPVFGSYRDYMLYVQGKLKFARG